MSGGWIGVDLDATLAYYDGWKWIDHIGDPVPEMLERVREWLAKGRSVKIFTARAATPEAVPHIRSWLERHGLGQLEITNVKDFGCVEIWDDRCVQVIPNTGRPVGGVRLA